MLRMGRALCFRIGRNDVAGRVHVHVEVGTAFQDLPSPLHPDHHPTSGRAFAGEMAKICKSEHAINAVSLDESFD